MVIKYGIYANIFAEKIWFVKATHIFFSKNTCELDIVVTRTFNILTTNELFKLWKTGPWNTNASIAENTMMTSDFDSIQSSYIALTALKQ